MLIFVGYPAGILIALAHAHIVRGKDQNVLIFVTCSDKTIGFFTQYVLLTGIAEEMLDADNILRRHWLKKLQAF